jgi:uncharacterized protein
MDCPVCGERLREIERSGVMVDVCPSCKGLWLDRGEIDKLIEAEAKGGRVAPNGPEHEQRREQERRDHDEHDHHDDRSYDHKSGGQKRRSSFLQDILGGFGE